LERKRGKKKKGRSTGLNRERRGEEKKGGFQVPFGNMLMARHPRASRTTKGQERGGTKATRFTGLCAAEKRNICARSMTRRKRGRKPTPSHQWGRKGGEKGRVAFRARQEKKGTRGAERAAGR